MMTRGSNLSSALLRVLALFVFVRTSFAGSYTVQLNTKSSCASSSGCSFLDFGNHNPGRNDDVFITADGNHQYIVNIDAKTVTAEWGSLTVTATGGATIQVANAWLCNIYIFNNLNMGPGTTLYGGWYIHVYGMTTISGTTNLNYETYFLGGLTLSAGATLGISGSTTVQIQGTSVMHGATTGPGTSIQVTGSLTMYSNTFQAPFNLEGGVSLYIKGGAVTANFIEASGTNSIYCDADSSLLVTGGYKANGQTQLQIYGAVGLWNLAFGTSASTITANSATGAYAASQLSVFGSVSLGNSQSVVNMLAGTTLDVYWNSAPQVIVQLQANVNVHVHRQFTFWNLKVMGNGCSVQAIQTAETDYGTIAISTLSWQSPSLTFVGGATFLNQLSIPVAQTMTVTGGPSVFQGMVTVFGSLVTAGTVTFQNSLWFSGTFTSNGDVTYQSFTATSAATLVVSNGQNIFRGTVSCSTQFTGTGSGSVFFMQSVSFPSMALSGDFYASFASSATFTSLRLSDQASIDFGAGTVSVGNLAMSGNTFLYLSTTTSQIGTSALSGNAYLLIETGAYSGVVSATDSSIVHLGNGVIHFADNFDSSSDSAAATQQTSATATTFNGRFTLSSNATFEITTNAVAVINQRSTVNAGARLDVSGTLQVSSAALDVFGIGYVGLYGQLSIVASAGSVLNVANSGQFLAHGSVVANGLMNIGSSQNDAANFTGVLHTGSSGTVTVNGNSLLAIRGISSFQGSLNILGASTLQVAPLSVVRFYHPITLSANTIVMGTLTAQNGYTQSAGTLSLNGGSIGGSFLTIGSKAVLSGYGALNLQTTVNGELSVTSPEMMMVLQGLTLSSTASYILNVQDENDYGVLSIIGSGAVHLGGSLRVNFVSAPIFSTFGFIHSTSGNIDGSFQPVASLDDSQSTPILSVENGIVSAALVSPDPTLAPTSAPTEVPTTSPTPSSSPYSESPSEENYQSSEHRESSGDQESEDGMMSLPSRAPEREQVRKTTTTGHASSTPSAQRHGLDAGVIAGIVVGAVAGAIVLAGTVAWVVLRKRTPAGYNHYQLHQDL